MRDLPSGPALLAVARDVLLNDLMPLLPPERRLDALLIANCMAIAEREGEGPAQLVGRELETFYAGAGLDTAASGILRRFADDLRIGAFENSQSRDSDARGILWRLTIAKLRLANPRFLTANGLG